jgi:CRP-like cAMP-binding protein
MLQTRMHNTFTLFNSEPDVRTIPEGSRVFSEGDPSEATMFAVLDGQIDIVSQGRLLERIATGGVFGEMALLD